MCARRRTDDNPNHRDDRDVYVISFGRVQAIDAISSDHNDIENRVSVDVCACTIAANTRVRVHVCLAARHDLTFTSTLGLATHSSSLSALAMTLLILCVLL
jgi:hypothetical protein